MLLRSPVVQSGSTTIGRCDRDQGIASFACAAQAGRTQIGRASGQTDLRAVPKACSQQASQARAARDK